MRSLLLFVLLATSACASFESGDLPHLDGWPPRPVAATQHARIEMNGLPDKFSWWPERTRAVFAASGRFDGVRVGTTGAPESSHAPRHEVLVRFDVRHDRPDGLPLTRAMMLVCALSAATIPARSVHTFDVRATFHDSAGNALGSVDRSIRSSTWVGWPLLFALPFAGVGMGELIDDTMRSIVVEASDAGWL